MKKIVTLILVSIVFSSLNNGALAFTNPITALKNTFNSRSDESLPGKMPADLKTACTKLRQKGERVFKNARSSKASLKKQSNTYNPNIDHGLLLLVASLFNEVDFLYENITSGVSLFSNGLDPVIKVLNSRKEEPSPSDLKNKATGIQKMKTGLQMLQAIEAEMYVSAARICIILQYLKNRINNPVPEEDSEVEESSSKNKVNKLKPVILATTIRKFEEDAGNRTTTFRRRQEEALTILLDNVIQKAEAALEADEETKVLIEEFLVKIKNFMKMHVTNMKFIEALENFIDTGNTSNIDAVIKETTNILIGNSNNYAQQDEEY